MLILAVIGYGIAIVLMFEAAGHHNIDSLAVSIAVSWFVSAMLIIAGPKRRTGAPESDDSPNAGTNYRNGG